MKSTIFSLFLTVLLLQWQSITVESAGTSEAKFIGATKGVDNQYMTVMEDEDVKSGWDTVIKKAITKKESSERIWVLMYSRTDPKKPFKDEEVAVSPLGTLLENTRNEYKNHITSEIINMIFPRQKGNRAFKEGDYPIRAIAQVHTDADGIQDTNLPKQTPYEMEVRLLSYEQASKSDNSEYLFKVNFSIGGDINTK